MILFQNEFLLQLTRIIMICALFFALDLLISNEWLQNVNCFDLYNWEEFAWDLEMND